MEGGHADLTLKVEEGWTALDKAQMNGFHAIVEYLQNKEDEMRRSVEASVLTRRTLEEVTEEGGEEEESANDVISIMEEQTNPDSDDNDGKSNQNRLFSGINFRMGFLSYRAGLHTCTCCKLSLR